MIAGSSALAQIDDFNDGNDTGWTQYDLLGGLGLGPKAQFSFPNGGYRIRAVVSPDANTYGPARAFSMRTDVTYSDFYAAVDVVDWDTSLDQAFGVAARVSNLGLGSTFGYVLNYDPKQSSSSGQLQINRVDNEQPTTIAELDINLDISTKDYRLVFKGVGDKLTGYVFDLSSPGSSPIAQISATDANHTSGICGLFVFDRSDVSSADATFDNYYASITEPPTQPDPPTISTTFFSSGQIHIGFETQAGFSYQVQKAAALPAQPQDWSEVQTFPAEGSVTVKQLDVPTSGSAGFLRIISPAPAGP